MSEENKLIVYQTNDGAIALKADAEQEKKSVIRKFRIAVVNGQQLVAQLSPVGKGVAYG